MTKQTVQAQDPTTDQSVDIEKKIANNKTSQEIHVAPKKTNIIEQNERRRQLHTTP